MLARGIAHSRNTNILSAQRRCPTRATKFHLNTRTSRRAYSSGIPSVPTVKLQNGAEMPVLGLGTWKSQPHEVARAVEHAIVCGYRHIDCAAVYKNEREVGEGIKRGMARAGITRKDLFITSKLWNTEHHPDRVKTACEQTLHDLGLGYLDMYLIHWPVSQLPPESGAVVAGDPNAEDIPLWETFEAMNLLVEEELCKGIGVSNFSISQLQDLIDDCDIIPQVNQFEVHPYLTQEKLVAFCQSKGIVVTAYSPLGLGQVPKGDKALPRLLDHPKILEIAQKHNKTAAQVLIRWSIQRGMVCIPKSVTPERIEENIKVFDFELDADDMKAISSLNINHRFVRPAFYTFPDDK